MKLKTQMRLARYVRPHWRALAVVLIVMLAHIGLGVLEPWPIKMLIDHVLDEQELPALLTAVFAWLPGPAGNQGLLFWVCASTILLYLAAKFTGMLSDLAFVRFGQRMAFDLGADLFRHVQRLSLLFHSRQPVGDTVARVTGDAYCVQELICDAWLPMLSSLLTLVTMFVIMWEMQPTMAVMALGVIPFLAVVTKLFQRPMEERSRIRRDLEGDMMALVEQTLSAMPAVQAFTREEIELMRFRHQARQTITAYLRSASVDAWFGLVCGLVTAVGTALIMWVGAQHVQDGKLTTGDVLVFLAYLAHLYGPLSTFTHTFSALQYAGAHAERVLELIDTSLDVKETPDAKVVPLRGHARYEDVTFGYEPDREVLKSISLEARPGEVVAIVGPTGAGKTTLVNLLLRFFDPWSGRVTVDGHDLRALGLRSLREQVAIVLQEPFIFPLTVAENIAYGRPGATHEEVVAAAVAASADDFIRRLPGGYDSLIGERGATLSGGEKQRLAIARAFLKNAPILILDEPTSALDARTEGKLLDALNRLMKGRTTLIIAHRLSTIRTADRILVVNQGEIVEEGRHAELIQRGGLYASLYRQQMEIVRHDVDPQPQPPAAAPKVIEPIAGG